MKPTMIDNKVWYLRQSALFSAATDVDIENCQHLFTTTIVPKRTRIFDIGDPTRIVYLVKRGAVRLYRITPDGKEVTIAVLGAGDIFGEEALFGSGPRMTVAVCLAETLLCTARADDLFALLESEPTLALNVAKTLNERLGDAEAAMEDLAYARVPDRIMRLFARMADEHGTPTPVGVMLDIRLTHADIASIVGSTRETVSLEIAALVRDGRLSIDDRRFVLPHGELATLRAASGG